MAGIGRYLLRGLGVGSDVPHYVLRGLGAAASPGPSPVTRGPVFGSGKRRREAGEAEEEWLLIAAYLSQFEEV